MKYEECPTCDGKGIDKERFKLPDAVKQQLVCRCFNPVDVDSLNFIREMNPRLPEAFVANLGHDEHCPRRTL